MESTEVLLARIDERQKSQDEKLAAILVQTTATNGRVTKLERWRAWILGACAAVSVILIVIETIVHAIK